MVDVRKEIKAAVYDYRNNYLFPTEIHLENAAKKALKNLLNTGINKDDQTWKDAYEALTTDTFKL